MPLSMTGFARTEAQHPWGNLACEVRSVNHRYLEVSLKLPETIRSIETDLRNTLRKQLSRGKVEVSFYLKTEQSDNTELVLNTVMATKINDLVNQLSQQLSNPAPINPIDILQWPGVLQNGDTEPAVIQKEAKTLFAATLKQLIANRQREGEELKQFIEQRLAGIDNHVIAVRKLLPEILAQHQTKLEEKLATLKVEIDQDRLAQELVYIAQKSDVAEELDRLDAHLNEVKHALAQKGPIGRRLDFLMQELNREANTLSSKSIASDTTQTAVDLKVLIEQMREQIQNLE